MEAAIKKRIIYDPLYSFIRLTELEWEIIKSPFYQRLRWIKQLGFSSYVFPGAEHSRFGHSIGVMYNSHCIMQSIGKAVPDEELFVLKHESKEALFHQSLRLAALLHDLGTFPFSHTTEMAYISYGDTNTGKNSKKKNLQDDHENLGSFIIKNTDYKNGITFILKKYGIDPQKISDLVKGVDSSVLANQILHSEIDCDRMDYLLRDAHYTGLQYGTYDRAYLLHHFEVANVGTTEVLTINQSALRCVEDFLQSRFAWYSQVIRSTRGAKYDAIAERICFYLLEKGMMLKYGELLELVSKNPNEFYKFNDMYFMGLIHGHYVNGDFDKAPEIKDMAECLLFQKHSDAIKHDALAQRLLNQDEIHQNQKHFKKAEDYYKKIQSFIKKSNCKDAWVVPDLPNKNNIVFVKSKSRIVKDLKGQNVLLTRDPVKIKFGENKVRLLAEVENSVIFKLQDSFNYIPNIYCSESAYKLLEENNLVD